MDQLEHLRSELAESEREVAGLKREDDRLNREVTRNGWGLTTSVVDSEERNRARHSEHTELKSAWDRVRAELRKAERRRDALKGRIKEEVELERRRTLVEERKEQARAQEREREEWAQERERDAQEARERRAVAATPEEPTHSSVVTTAGQARGAAARVHRRPVPVRTSEQEEALERLERLGTSVRLSEPSSTAALWQAAAGTSTQPSIKDIEVLGVEDARKWLKRVHALWCTGPAGTQWIEERAQVLRDATTWDAWRRGAARSALEVGLRTVLPLLLLVLGALVEPDLAVLLAAGALGALVGTARLWWWHPSPTATMARYAWHSGSVVALGAGVLARAVWDGSTGGDRGFVDHAALVLYLALVLGSAAAFALGPVRGWLRTKAPRTPWPTRPGALEVDTVAIASSPEAVDEAVEHFRRRPEDFTA
jgi:hypothetical protein